MQELLNNSQEAYFKIQSELMKIRGEKATAESELESVRRKCTSVESRAKQHEMTLREEYVSDDYYMCRSVSSSLLNRTSARIIH